MLQLLSDLKNEHVISELNYQFAKMIDRKQQTQGYSDTQKNLALLLSALVSHHVMQGHSCLSLNSLAATAFFGLQSRKLSRDYQAEILQKIGKIDPLVWQEILSDHIAFSSNPEHIAPLLFQHERLYFYRYWQAEQHIAMALKQAVNIGQNSANLALDRQILARFFPIQNKIDWQKVAVATALKQPFCLISGGPGTGKTRTVAILLASLQLKQIELGLPPLRIALAAPTGKAAARLKESISANLQQLDLPDSIKQLVPVQATTIHTLLGFHPHRDLPEHHAQNPLHIDLLVVDEASMIDLFVMEKLMNALKADTRLIMLGDKDQLASVEAGNAMSELGELLTLGYSQAHCDYLSKVTDSNIFPQNSAIPPICDSLCHLRHSYRFDENSGIGELAKRINAQQAAESWQILTNSRYADLALNTYPEIQHFPDKNRWIAHAVTQVVDLAVELYRDYLTLVQERVKDVQRVSVSQIFSAFQKVRFLSALRVSELGVERLNQSIADALRQQRLLSFKQHRENYIGKPILITENAPQQQIFSGDIGLVLPDESGKLRVYFETEQPDCPRSLSPSRVPNYEPAYVMTVHKSQGSEFAHTVLIMPLSASPVLTKELLYTAVTRAKQQFTLFADEKTWRGAVKAKVARQSGLKEQILSLSA